MADCTFNAVFKNPPFRIQEEGWGEFDMQIEFTTDKSYFISHDLNFAQNRYESKHVLVSRVPSDLLCLHYLTTDRLWFLLDLQEPQAGIDGCLA